MWRERPGDPKPRSDAMVHLATKCHRLAPLRPCRDSAWRGCLCRLRIDAAAFFRIDSELSLKQLFARSTRGRWIYLGEKL